MRSVIKFVIHKHKSRYDIAPVDTRIIYLVIDGPTVWFLQIRAQKKSQFIGIGTMFVHVCIYMRISPFLELGILLSRVVLIFFRTHKCVPKHIFWSFLANGFLCSSWYETDCLIHVFVLIATLLGLHGGAGLVIHSGHPPHIATHLIHEYHVNIL
jgi:hypothetical protein